MFLVSSLILAIGFFVFLQNKSSLNNIVFFLFCLSLNLWLYGRVFMYCSKEAETALWIARRVAKLGVSHIAPLVYTFSVLWLDRYERQKPFVIVGFVMALAVYLTTNFSLLVVTSVHKYFWGYYPVYGIGGKLFLVFFFSYFTAAFYNFFSELRKTQDPIRKKQIQLCTVAFLISFTGSFDYLPKVIHYPLYPFGYMSVFIWTMVIGYSIVKYKVLDIQTVVHKTVMWLLSSSIVGIPIILFFHIFKDWVYHLSNPGFILVLGAVVFLGVIYLRNVQPHIDEYFQRRSRDLIQAMEKFNDTLVHHRSLREITRHILITMEKVLYAGNVSLLLRDRQRGIFTLEHLENYRGQVFELPAADPLAVWLEHNDRIVQREYLSLDPDLLPIKNAGLEFFNRSQALLAVPLIIGQQVIGILSLGQKENLQGYRPADINFLTDLRRSAAIALSNAMHLEAEQESLRRWNEDLEKKVDERTEELKHMQAQLIQAEKMATMGTLSGGVAHEINNPLAAILANAQLLKMEATGDDLESLQLIEEGAKRCQMIVQKLMKYSRKSIETEQMSEISLKKVIRNVVSMLEYQMNQENVKIVLDIPDLEPVQGIQNELEQVFTNLLVNSRDALKGKEGEAFIKIRAFQDAGKVCVTVEDNGLGIAKHHLTKIFDPFFTTKDVGKGTGLGLAVSYGILQKHHCQVAVQSTEGQGTVFTLSFPKNGVQTEKSL
ncbi:MAG: hypothetical protein A2Z83_02880 [Omnitrophica bacterium GWA2_52_8]|nr:MAG: hypothetical protein A2Z83_02880 [Omnitrophica bacterium GWA2_52_8]